MINNIYQIDQEKIKDRKVVIFGCGHNARGLAIQMLNEDICFHGFLIPDDAHTYSKVSLWNKPLLNINECSKIDRLAIVSQPSESEYARGYLQKYDMDDKFIQVQKLHQKLTDSPFIVIYGTKLNAEFMLQKVQHDVNVKYFCDSNETKKGKEFCKRKILGINELAQVMEHGNIPILVASRFYQEIIEELGKITRIDENVYLDLDYFQYENYSIFIGEGGEDSCIPMPLNNPTACSSLQKLVCDSKRYQLVLCGDSISINGWHRKLQLLSINTDTFCYKKSRPITEQFINRKEDQLYVMVGADGQELEQEIIKTGFAEKFTHISRYTLFLQYSKLKLCADPIMGFTFKNKTDNEDVSYPTYGYRNDSQEHIYQILVLGNSTSAEVGSREKQWSWYLSEILRSKNIPHQIICCGMVYYKVFQELLLLIRDGLGLQPDLVISYSGCCDHDNRNNLYYQFLHPWQRKLFLSISEAMDKNKMEWHEIPGYAAFSGVTFGIKKENNGLEDWFESESTMNDICRAKGIKFYAFWQPVLLSKEVWTKNERQMALAELEVLKDEDTGELIDADTYLKSNWMDQKRMNKQCKNISKQREWFTDLSGIFNTGEEVYYDSLHIYPDKNEFVARRIWDTIKQELAAIAT